MSIITHNSSVIQRQSSTESSSSTSSTFSLKMDHVVERVKPTVTTALLGLTALLQTHPKIQAASCIGALCLEGAESCTKTEFCGLERLINQLKDPAPEESPPLVRRATALIVIPEGSKMER